jgi:hypothetical protein
MKLTGLPAQTSRIMRDAGLQLALVDRQACFDRCGMVDSGPAESDTRVAGQQCHKEGLPWSARAAAHSCRAASL